MTDKLLDEIRKNAEEKYGNYETGSLCTRDHINGYRSGYSDAFEKFCSAIDRATKDGYDIIQIGLKKPKWTKGYYEKEYTTAQLLEKYLSETKSE